MTSSTVSVAIHESGRKILYVDGSPVAAQAESGSTVVTTKELSVAGTREIQAWLGGRRARSVPQSVIQALADGKPLPPQRWIGSSGVRLASTTAADARVEAHDVHGWHVLPPAYGPVWPVTGVPSAAVWCVRGPRRAVIIEDADGYVLIEGLLVDDEVTP